MFRLTVTDDDGATASAYASVTVRPEIDVVQYLTAPIAAGESPGLIAAVIDARGVVRGVGAAASAGRARLKTLAVNDVFHIASTARP